MPIVHYVVFIFRAQHVVHDLFLKIPSDIIQFPCEVQTDYSNECPVCELHASRPHSQVLDLVLMGLRFTEAFQHSRPSQAIFNVYFKKGNTPGEGPAFGARLPVGTLLRYETVFSVLCIVSSPRNASKVLCLQDHVYTVVFVLANALFSAVASLDSTLQIKMSKCPILL